ncbi:MAG: hypothetical protein Q9169_005487 [Polycauliona sp. 2 TL-2023]
MPSVSSIVVSGLPLNLYQSKRREKPGKRSGNALSAYCASYIKSRKKQYQIDTMVFKLSVALVGALAVVAQAGYGRRHIKPYQNNPQYMTHGNNQTSSVAETSSTVANSPETTSSAPTETFPTSTPGTSTIANSTETASSAPLETFPTFTPDSSTPGYGSPSSTVVPTVPLTTAPFGTSDNSPAPTVGNHTLTYTLGTGSSTTVVTTTIVQTSTKTQVNTIYATSDSEAGVTGGVSSVGGDSEPTTTITSTSTSTITKVVKPTGSGTNNNSPVGASGVSKCPVPVTVTVTGSPVTVTVTADSGSASSESPETTEAPSSSSAPYPVTSTTKKTKTKCPTASSGFITKPYPTFTNQPSADITFSHPTSTGAAGYM